MCASAQDNILMIQKRDDGWWIVAYSDREASGTEYGPYATKAEAVGDKQGLERFYQDIDESHMREPVAMKVPVSVPSLSEASRKRHPRRRRRFKYASNQKMLPGFELE